MVGQFTEVHEPQVCESTRVFPPLPSLHAPSRLDSTGLRRPPSPGSHLPLSPATSQLHRLPRHNKDEHTEAKSRNTPPPHTIPVRRSDQSRRRRRRRGSPPAEIHRRGSVTRGGIAIPCCYASDGGGHSSGAAAAEEWRGRGDAKEVGNGESGKEEIVCLGDSEKKVNPFLSTLFFFTPLLLLFFFPFGYFSLLPFPFWRLLCSLLCLYSPNSFCLFLSLFFFARRNLFSFFHI